MIQIILVLFTGLVVLASIAASFYVLYLLYKERGAGHAALGFFFPIYTYVWGWLNSKRLEILDIMGFWTAMTVISVIVPIIMTTLAVADLANEIDTLSAEPGAFNEGDAFAFSSEPSLAVSFEDAIQMGSVPVGGRVEARIDDLFEIHNWTFDGSSGQTVTVQANALPGETTDPRVNLLGPDGALLTGDDDGGDNTNALIPGYVLPADGQYILQVDVWQTGDYELIVN